MFLPLVERSIKLVSFVCLLLTLIWGNAIAANPAPELPVRALVVTMAKGGLQNLLEQLRQFSDENAFAIRTSQSSPDPEHILVQMWREDIKGVGVNTSETGAADISYSVAFYRNCNDAVPEWAFDAVVTRLRRVLIRTEGVSSVTGE